MTRALTEFARLLGLQPRHAEPALNSERAAKFVLNRRQFLGATSLGVGAAFVPFQSGEVLKAMSGQAVHSLPKAPPLSSVHLIDQSGRILERWYPGEQINRVIARRIDRSISSIRLVRVGQKTPFFQYHIAPGSPCYGWVWSPKIGEVIVA